MDVIDRQLLRLAQQGLALNPHPFLTLGEALDITEDEVITRLTDLKNRGLIRRLGGVFDSSYLGYVSALCAMQVEMGEADSLAAIVNSYPGVTHNYLRDNPQLNLWFTLTCASESEFKNQIAELAARTKRKVHCFPVLRRYKIKFALPLTEEDDDST